MLTLRSGGGRQCGGGKATPACGLTNRKYRRDFAGLGLRGLAWLLPAGLGMKSAGYGWTVLLGGVFMAAVYDMVRDTPSHGHVLYCMQCWHDTLLLRSWRAVGDHARVR